MFRSISRRVLALSILSLGVAVSAHATPIANAGGPYTTVSGAALTLDGSGSYDTTAGLTLTYAWDLFGTGLYNDSTAVDPQVIYSGAVGMTFSPCLKVSDGIQSSHSCATVTIVDPAKVSAATPEPNSILLAGTGLLGAAGAVRRKMRS